MAPINNNVNNNNVNNNNVNNNNAAAAQAKAPRYTTFGGLCAAIAEAPANYWFKAIAAAVASADTDTHAIEWHLEAIGIAKFGNACLTWADAEKTALIVPAKAKAAEPERAESKIGGLLATIDLLTAATKATYKNAAAVAAVAAQADGIRAAQAEAEKAAADKAEKAAKRAEKRHTAAVEALTFAGLTSEAAEAQADNVAIIKGRKDEKGHYCFKFEALAMSMEYTHAEALKAARAAALAQAQAQANDNNNAAEAKAEKAAREAVSKFAAAVTDFMATPEAKGMSREAAIAAVAVAKGNKAAAREALKAAQELTKKGVSVDLSSLDILSLSAALKANNKKGNAAA